MGAFVLVKKTFLTSKPDLGNIFHQVSDLSILASQLSVEFDDLLWVLTDSQVQSALLCVKSIREIIERSEMQRKGRSSSQV